MLSPAGFGLVMATGIVSLAAGMLNRPVIAQLLFVLNIGQFVLLTLLYAARAWRYPRRFFGDMTLHARAPGYFTVVAGIGILASQVMQLARAPLIGAVLWAFCVLSWLVLTYTIFLAFTVRDEKPAFDKGINGAWLLAVVATQAIAVSSTQLATMTGGRFAPELDFLALVMWLWGGCSTSGSW